jgi:hypothetical protein
VREATLQILGFTLSASFVTAFMLSWNKRFAPELTDFFNRFWRVYARALLTLGPRVLITIWFIQRGD